MIDIYGFTLPELKDLLVQNGYKEFNARQVFEWLYKKKVFSFEEMTNIGKDLKKFLNENYSFGTISETKRKIANDGTEKYLFELQDGNLVESVLMKHPYGNSVCVTSQVGCNMGCSFCASGLHNKVRDLSASEMVLQVLKVEELAKQRVSHVVVMGTGEPFDNYDNTMSFIKIINSPYGLEIGARHITVSTSGLVDKIKRFADEKLQVNLAISLHASNNSDRSVLMKINKRYTIEEVIDAAKYYVSKTNRRITFEYILLKGINDSIGKADELSDLLRGLNCYVNLIRYNKVEEFDFEGSSEKQAALFKDRLAKRGINVTLRKEMGSNIDAACGQLRIKKIGGSKNE
jgi:23S rRNA (adenine2503-C2)-methyltransferase